MKDSAVAILRLGAEGGGISLFGHQDATGQWQFAVLLVDQTPSLLAGADAADEIVRSSGWVLGWDSALDLLDRRCRYWPDLHPIEVHPSFYSAMLAAVLIRRGQGISASWAEDIEMQQRLARRRSMRK